MNRDQSRPADALAAFRDPLAFSFFNAMTWMIALGTPMVLLAGQLGATTAEVGIAYAFVFLLLPVQIIATVTLPRFGYKKQMIFGWSVRAVFLLVPLGLAILAPERPQRWMVYALVGSVFFFALFRSLGSCAVMPWIYALVPEQVRGRYFATDQSLMGIAGVFTLLLCAALFAFLPLYQAFTLQYAFSIFGSIMAVLFLGRMRSVEKPRDTSVKEIARLTPQLSLRRSGFRQYLIFMIVTNVVMSSFGPFTAYYLKIEAEIGMDRILFYNAFQYLGSISGALFIRSRIDSIGVKPVFRTALVFCMVLMLFWILVVAGYTFLLPFIPLSYFVLGLYACNWVAAHLKYLPRVCPDADQALAVSVHSAVVGVIGGLAPIAWGFVIKESGTLPGIRSEPFIAYLLVTLLVQLGLWFYVPRLTSKRRSVPSLQASAGGIRVTRYLSNMVTGLRSHPPEEKNGNPPRE